MRDLVGCLFVGTYINQQTIVRPHVRAGGKHTSVNAALWTPRPSSTKLAAEIFAASLDVTICGAGSAEASSVY